MHLGNNKDLRQPLIGCHKQSVSLLLLGLNEVLALQRQLLPQLCKNIVNEHALGEQIKGDEHPEVRHVRIDGSSNSRILDLDRYLGKPRRPSFRVVALE